MTSTDASTQKNAFIGKTEAPSHDEIVRTLGDSDAAWEEFIQWCASTLHVDQQEWKGVYPDKYGWSLRLKQKKRNIVYLSPCQGCFRVSLVLGDRAMEKVRATAFPRAAAAIIDHAPKYPEGTGITFTVKSVRDLPPIRTLSAIKVAN